MKVDVLKKWIAAGLLQSRQVGRARMIAPAEITRFRETYCLRAEALRILGIAGTTLRSWQDAGRILPVYPKRVTPYAGLYLYRRGCRAAPLRTTPSCRRLVSDAEPAVQERAVAFCVAPVPSPCPHSPLHTTGVPT